MTEKLNNTNREHSIDHLLNHLKSLNAFSSKKEQTLIEICNKVIKQSLHKKGD
tara:strand:+ start:4486 stop:4644 length:159 start_codon:yes stop_codon:yes gene_type:complete